jgi:ATP-dependent Clp protease ATP-binding subunit ClpB
MLQSARGVNIMQMQDYNNDENILEKFGRNLNNEVKNGKMDPVI